MCGIVGFMYKNGANAVPLGTQLSAMAGILGSRGLDSTGMAMYGKLPSGRLVMRAQLEAASGDEGEGKLGRLRERVGTLVTVEKASWNKHLARLEFSGVENPDDLGLLRRITDAAEAADGIQVFSIGSAMEIIKDTGPASDLDVYQVQKFKGTHGLAHTRLATESIVNTCSSHPFWARPFADIAVVHNGQLTNHNILRRRFEHRGYHFLTTNDSEVIAVYIADKLLHGKTLHEALTDSITELDGTFTYLVATEDSIGFAKDRFATKPLVIAENDTCVALASEEVALAPVITKGTQVWEPTAKTVRTWSR
ncbi:MAG: hypothetical protein FJ317_02815 [SAR202 cluster bacterium]|nr:hypothetical protein [SAR202 cluster bacterium]